MYLNKKNTASHKKAAYGVDYSIVLSKDRAKAKVRDHRHNGGSNQDAENGGKKALFGIEPEHRGDQRTCPRACSGQWHGYENGNAPIGIFLDRSLVFFHLAVKPRGNAREKLDAATPHPRENGTNEQENEGHGQQVARNAEKRRLPPRHSEPPAKRHRSAALDNGEH